MLKYRGNSLVRAGFIGVVLMVLTILVGLQPEKLITMATRVHHEAYFADAGGLAVGDEVRVSGVIVGYVSSVDFSQGKALVDFSIDGTVALTSETTAKIKTGSLLGKRIMEVVSKGDGAPLGREIIPMSRTSSPYSLTDAVGDLTKNTAGTDTDTLNQSLDTLSQTLDQVAPQLGPTFDALTALSKTINGRNANLRDLLRTTSTVTKVLGERSEKVNTLILNANDLIDVLAQRRQAIVDLLANVSVVARELSGVIADNNAELGPTLDKLNAVLAVLQKNSDNIAKALPGLAKYATALGEAVSSGPYYNAFVANLLPAQLMQPFVDAYFGQKPRAKLPFPHREGTPP